jgi:hypothetical protein
LGNNGYQNSTTAIASKAKQSTTAKANSRSANATHHSNADRRSVNASIIRQTNANRRSALAEQSITAKSKHPILVQSSSTPQTKHRQPTKKTRATIQLQKQTKSAHA